MPNSNPDGRAAAVPASVRSGQPTRPMDHEGLDVYRVAIEFQLLAATICRRPELGALRDQLDRASVSVVLNIAEGAGRTAPAEKARFFTIARGSATECSAACDLLLARRVISPEVHAGARDLLGRVVSMLVGLTRRRGPADER
ncbi:MAG: four helix bundle protein [Vicinamibacteria bacterium]